MRIEDKVREQLRDVKKMRDLAMKLRNAKYTGTLRVEWRDGRIQDWKLIGQGKQDHE